MFFRNLFTKAIKSSYLLGPWEIISLHERERERSKHYFLTSYCPLTKKMQNLVFRVLRMFKYTFFLVGEKSYNIKYALSKLIFYYFHLYNKASR